MQVFKVLLDGDFLENLELFSSAKSKAAVKDVAVNMHCAPLRRIFVQFVKQLTEISWSVMWCLNHAFSAFRRSPQQIKLEIFFAQIIGKEKT